MTVVLRHIPLSLESAADDPFARGIAMSMRRLGYSNSHAIISLTRFLNGSWILHAGSGQVAIDELAVGAAAARHLAALGARDLRYAGPVTETLRRRGFSIAAGALGCDCAGLDGAPANGLLGIFADGVVAETAALAHLSAAGLTVPRDALLLGIADGNLPPPRAPGLSRLRLDPERLVQAALALIASGRSDCVLVPPSGVVTRASSDDSGGDDPRLAAALAHLRVHLHRPLDVAVLARAAGQPRRSLERLFRAALGRSPLDEIRRQRVARAQELLAHSDLPLEQIAQRVGFSGPDRLGVVFRQVAGVTPGSWRRQHRTG